ncbi:MAG: hypothetical protein Q8P49_03240 [Candidatus Liptonbacteria bacterium]|nr:hypothetical protein [Candidatus Liptonbacteria bacterium]
MTFIQPNKKNSFLNGILIFLGLVAAAEVFGVVMLYNATVNMTHDIAEAKLELDAVGAANVDLNNRVMGTLSGAELLKLAAERGLVPDSKPQYFSLSQSANQKWPIASH